MKDTRRPEPSHRRLRLGFLRAALGVLLACTPMMAQNEQDQPEGLTEFNVEGDLISIAVNEVNGLQLKDFITLCRQITGRVIVYQQNDLNVPNAAVTWSGTVRVRRENFFAFFQTMLYIRGFACVPRATGDTEIVEIVSMQGPRRAEISASAQYVAPDAIEEYRNQTGVTILTSVSLENINAQTATTSTRPFFSQAAGTQGTLLTGNLGDNRTLLLQGFGPQVYAAYQLLKLADVPPRAPEHETRIFPLEHATAEELEPILQRVLEERQRAIQQGQGASGGAIQAGAANQVQVLAHGSLNSLLVSGPPDRVASAFDLIAKLDAPVEIGGGDIHVIQLRNVLAEDLQQVLRDFLREDLQAERQQQAGQSAQIRQPRPTVIRAHPASNSLLISATQSRFKQIQSMVDQLDERQPQVLIEAALVELTTTDLDRLGVELGLLNLVSEGSDATNPFGFTNSGLSTFQDTDDDGLPDTRLPDFDNPLQGLTGGIITGTDFAIPVLVNALQQDDRANILSLPSVVVNNNESALVKSEEDRPTQVVTNNGAGQQTQGVGDPRRAGIELSISPSISNNDYLRLNIDLTVSRFLGQADPTTGGVTIARQVQTQVTLPSGDTMVLGGIIEDSESESESGVPYLKDIPILGFLFRTKTQNKNKTNLYFFVTPQILHEKDFSDLREVTQRKKLEASEYIGHRRLKIVDRRWTDGRTLTLDDSSTTIEHLNRAGGFDLIDYRKSTKQPDPKELGDSLPTGPASPEMPEDDAAPNTGGDNPDNNEQNG